MCKMRPTRVKEPLLFQSDDKISPVFQARCDAFLSETRNITDDVQILTANLRAHGHTGIRELVECRNGND